MENFKTPILKAKDVSQFILERKAEQIFLPKRQKGWTALDENGTGKESGINLAQLGKRLNKAADAADAIGKALEITKDKLLF